MSEFSKRIKEIRESFGMNKSQFAAFLGTNVANITRYEQEDMGISMGTAEEIAKKLGVNPGWLIGWDTEKYPTERIEYKKIPVLGVIAAGTPILAQQNIEGYEYIPPNVHADFCLRVKGDSMINARILDGDIVYIRQQPDVENGEIAAVLIDEEDATLKRVYKVNGTIILRAENPNYPDRVFSKKDKTIVRILGKALLFRSEVR